ncbi:MAG: response regulator [Anaerolineae bacterium]|nr:response regulator [Anaerolineae bacterium]
MSQAHSLARQPLRILLLEDAPKDAELIACEIDTLLKTYQLHVVSNRDEFVAALDNFEPHLILSDYKVPWFNGDEALRVAQKQVPHTPFIFVTGTMDDEELAAYTILNGASGFVLKKNLWRLPQVIAQAMAEASTRNETQQSFLQLQEKVNKQREEIAKYKESLAKMRRKLQDLQLQLNAQKSYFVKKRQDDA